MNLLIWGRGGHAGVVSDAAVRTPAATAFVESLEEMERKAAAWGKCFLILGFGDRVGRMRVVIELGNQPWKSVIHERACVADRRTVKVGTFVADGAVIAESAETGHHCIINHNATVDHDCVLADHCIVCPGANLGGGVQLGKAVLVGMGAVVLPKVRIGEGATVGAGAVVTKDVPPLAVVVGNPARIVRYATWETLPC